MTAYVYDTETTGIVEPIEVVEAAWIKLSDPSALMVEDEWEMRFRPSKAIELGALATHHIMDEDLVGMCYSPSSECHLPDDCTIIIGHNVDFDWKVMGSPKVRRIDVMAMTWRVWPELGKISQGALLYHLYRGQAREWLRNAHGALQDCRNCLRVVHAIVAQLAIQMGAVPFTSWESMWAFSEEARVPDIMPFGKHKGLPMDEVPEDYKRWLLGQPDVDPYLRRALLGQRRRTPRVSVSGDPA